MKRKLIITITIILIVVGLKPIYNITINNILIAKYNNNEYSEKLAQSLMFLNFPQGYIAKYNYGNILYKNGKYEDAIEKYKEALNYWIPRDKECSIRINYALAICKTVQVDENDAESIQNAIETYESAIDILTEKGCANKNDNNGHSVDAEQLKKDIQKEIERLKKKNNSESSKSEEKEEKDKKEEKSLEQKIQKIKEEAIQIQREQENKYGGYNYTRVEKNW